MILYEEESSEKAVRLARFFRSRDMAARLQLRSKERMVEAYATSMEQGSVANLLYLDEKGLSVRLYNAGREEADEIPLSEYLKD